MCRAANVEAVTKSKARRAAAHGPAGAPRLGIPSTFRLRHPSFRPSLRRNFAWTFLGNVVYGACQWGMLIVMAKLGSPEMVGLFVLAIAVTHPVMSFSGLQLRAIQAADAKGAYAFADYLGLRLVTSGLAMLVITAFALAYRWEVLLVILAAALAKAVESISDVLFGLLQQHERMDRIAVSMVVKGVLSLVALGGAVVLTGKVFWGVLAMAGAWALVLLTYDVPNGLRTLRAPPPGDPGSVSAHRVQDADGALIKFRPRFHTGTLVRLACVSLPLGIVAMLLSLNANMPRYFVERHFGEYELGIFAALGYLGTIGVQITNALGQSAGPRMARYHRDGAHDAFHRLFARLLLLQTAMGAMGIVVVLAAGREILRFLYRPEFSEYSGVLFWIMVSAAFYCVASALGYAATATQRLAGQPLVLTVTVAASLASCWLLVPRYALVGAALSVAVASLVCAGGYALLFRTRVQSS